ncbi:hypothetical protein FRC09_013485 [Ceratobasidium sp. 395]|nr:hypothetical protein FRC09_013485 [Ceratobasidium sp. 395]
MSMLSGLTSYDDVTLVLLSGLILTVTAGIVSRSEPLAHPLVLGQQSEPSKVRRPTESAVYRNYGVGMYMPTTNTELQNQITALGSGLVQKLNLAPRDSSVLLLMEDNFECLLSILALSSFSVTPIIISHLQLLNPVLSVHPPSAIIVQSSFLHVLLEQLADEQEEGLHLIVVGEIDALAESHARKTGLILVRWADLIEIGSEAVTLETADLPTANDVFMHPKAVQLTHQNMTAAVVSARGLFAISSPVSSNDRILSSFSMNTPFGIAVAFQALWEAKGSFLYSLAWKRKMGALLEGSISRATPWDRVVFEEARSHWSVADLRGVVTAGEPSDPSTQAICSIAMSVPIVRAHIHPLSASPILASHPLDLQRHFPATGGSRMSKDPLHVGPPAPSVEIKLINVNESDIEAGNDPRGEMLIRGTSVGTPLSESSVPYPDGWLPTGERALVQSNGTFKVVGRQRRTVGP